MIVSPQIAEKIRATNESWLITGAAGFIGSHLVETLLALDQRIIGLDNFSTGSRSNLDAIRENVQPAQWNRFTIIDGDIRDEKAIAEATHGVTRVLHQAALGSVPRSIADPLQTHEANCTGFLKMLIASRDAGVQRFVYAASSSTYGDHPDLPKIEDRIGRPMSPYAVTKLVNELYADVFSRCYGFNAIGLRYFNVFGPRQDPNGPYAAVIPRWISSMIQSEQVFINGDGNTSRDFCYVANAVQANLLAALESNPQALNQIYNVAVGNRTTLNELFTLIQESLASKIPGSEQMKPSYRAFRQGDVQHSLADIGKARQLLGYEPTHDVKPGIIETVQWHMDNHRPALKLARKK